MNDESNSDGDDGDRTSPNLGEEEHTHPGHVAAPFAAVAAGLGRAASAVRSLAEICDGLQGDERRRCLWALAMRLGDLGDLSHDTRRVTLALIREEDAAPRNGDHR